MRPTSLLALAALLVGCAPKPEFEDLEGLWGRSVDGEQQAWELARQIDATGLEDVLPAFRRWQYDMDSSPREVARGRWNPFGHELVITPGWSLIDSEEVSPSLVLVENQTIVLEVDDFTPVELLLLYPGEEEPRKYVRLETLPQPDPE